MVNEQTAEISLANQKLNEELIARKENEKEIQQQLDELQRWHTVTMGREDRIIRLKQEVNSLLRQQGKPARYSSQDSSDEPENEQK